MLMYPLMGNTIVTLFKRMQHSETHDCLALLRINTCTISRCASEVIYNILYMHNHRVTLDVYDQPIVSNVYEVGRATKIRTIYTVRIVPIHYAHIPLL